MRCFYDYAGAGSAREWHAGALSSSAWHVDGYGSRSGMSAPLSCALLPSQPAPLPRCDVRRRLVFSTAWLGNAAWAVPSFGGAGVPGA